MTDIVNLLRWRVVHADQEQAIEAMERAADEIERLRTALDEMEQDQHQSNNLQWREIERLRDELVKCGELLDADLLARAVKAEAEIERLRTAYNREVSLRDSEQREADEQQPADNPYDHGREIYERGWFDATEKAADEIERLREALLQRQPTDPFQDQLS